MTLFWVLLGVNVVLAIFLKPFRFGLLGVFFGLLSLVLFFFAAIEMSNTYTPRHWLTILLISGGIASVCFCRVCFDKIFAE